MLLKKNMNRFLYIFSFGILLSVLYTSGVGSAPATKSIIDEIRNDSVICSTALFLYNLTYTSSCASLQYPSKPFKMSDENSNKFLCLGLYEISYHICYSDSRNSNFTSLPDYEQILKSQLPNVLQLSNNRTKFCERQQSWKYLQIYEKTKQAVSMLKNAFKVPEKCDRICFDFDGKFNPLCAIWVWGAHLLTPGTPDFDRNNNSDLILSSKNKSNIDNHTLHQISLAAVRSSVSESEDTKKEKNKQNGRPPSGKQNDPKTLTNDHEPKSSSKDNDNAQASNISLSFAVQHHQDSEIETKSLTPDKIYENSNAKSESSIVSTNKTSKELEKSAGSSIDGKNIDPSQKMENTGASINQTVTPLQNADDQKYGNSEDLIGDHPYDTEDGVVVQDPSNSGPSLPKPSEIKDTFPYNPRIRTEDDSHFFTYFVVITLLCIGGYVGYHNKQKILAIVLEGRRSRGSRGRRRPNTASYRKLDCTLEEAVTSQCNTNVSHVIY